MAIVTLQQLITSAQRFSDLENSNYVNFPNEWTDYVNFGVLQYWNKMNQVLEDYNLVETFFTTTPAQTDYPLPDDFMYIRGLDVALTPATSPPPSSTIWNAILPYEFKERSYYNYPWFVAYAGYAAFRYRVQTIDNVNIVRLLPPPVPAFNMRLSYIPVAPLFDAMSLDETMNGYNGFDVYISAWAAYRALMKQEFDVSYVKEILAEWEKTIDTNAQERNRDVSERVTDVHRRGFFY